MRRALEEDESFRSWVAETADEQEAGRLAWLWVARPEGWSDELAGLMGEAEAEQELHVLADRVVALEADLLSAVEARSHLEEANAGLTAEVARLEEELVRTEAARAAAAQRAERATAATAGHDERTARLELDLAGAQESRAQLEAELAELRGRLADAEQAAQAARQRVEVAEGRAAANRARADEAEARTSMLERRLRERAERDAEDRVGDTEAAARLRSTVGEAVERAAAAATELGSALGAAAAALVRPEPAPSAHPPPGEAPAPAGRPAAVDGEPRTAAAGAAAMPAPPHRRVRQPTAAPRSTSRLRPIPLPPAVFADSTEAAAHLARVPGIHLVIDGYNVALTSWPGAGSVSDLPALRRRLLDAVSEMVMRTKTAVTVVFDGTDQMHRLTAARPVRQWLRIIFSASSIEADEVILEEVARLRPWGPVAVATDDRAVREGADRLGANVISVRQLMAVLNRHTAL